jgi:hypothetical protein
VSALLTLLIALGLVLAASLPASAHAGGLSPTQVRGEVLSVAPLVPGLDVTAIEDGARLRVRNSTGQPVEVLAGGGQARAVTVPAGETMTWIDARATTLERDLDGASSDTWTVPMSVGSERVVVTGEHVAGAPPVSLAWWALALGIAVALVIVIRRSSRHPHVLLAVAGLVTVLASVIHVVGASLAVESAPLWGTFIDATGIGLLVWPLVVASAVAAVRGRAGGVLGVCAGAGLSVVFILPDITVFHFSVLPVAGPASLERLLVAVVLGTGCATAIAGAGVLRTVATRASGGTHSAPPLSERELS